MAADHKLWNRVSFEIHKYVTDPRNDNDKDCLKYRELGAEYVRLMKVSRSFVGRDYSPDSAGRHLVDENLTQLEELNKKAKQLEHKMIKPTALTRFYDWKT